MGKWRSSSFVNRRLSMFLETEILELQSFFTLEKKSRQSRIVHALRSNTGQLLTVRSERELWIFTAINTTVSTPRRRGLRLLSLGRGQQMTGGSFDFRGGIGFAEHAPCMPLETMEFLKAFWPEMGKDILEVITGFTKSSLPESSRRAVLKRGNFKT